VKGLLWPSRRASCDQIVKAVLAVIQGEQAAAVRQTKHYVRYAKEDLSPVIMFKG
jgi:hypothetical protein